MRVHGEKKCDAQGMSAPVPSLTEDCSEELLLRGPRHLERAGRGW